MDIFDCYTEETKNQEQPVFDPINPYHDKSEVFDPLTRALVSCPQLKKYEFSTRNGYNNNVHKSLEAFSESMRRALGKAKENAGEEFTVKLM